MVRKSRNSRNSAVSIVRTPVSTAITIPQPLLLRQTAVPRQRTSRRTRGNAQMRNPQTACDSYIRTLNDPFENPAIRLGWGTMVPTGLGTAFFRGSIITSDGNFAIAIEPQLKSNSAGVSYPICTANAGAATWVRYNWSNNTAFAGLADSLRVVSLGLKVLPMVPQTSVPGLLYTGAVTGQPYGNITALTPAQLAASPALIPGYGQMGAIALGRPVDPTSFMFLSAICTGPATSGFAGSTPFSIPVVSGTGFPANTTIWFECVMNFEYEFDLQLNTNAASDPLEGGQEETRGLMSSVFSNIESMWNFVKNRLLPTGIVQNIANFALSSLASSRSMIGAPARHRLMAPVPDPGSSPDPDLHVDDSIERPASPPRSTSSSSFPHPESLRSLAARPLRTISDREERR